MNSKRKIFTPKITNYYLGILNPDWFIGFREGKATFGIKTSSALYFQITQKNTSLESLNSLTTNLMWLPEIASSKNEMFDMYVVSTTKKKKQMQYI